MQFGPNCQVIVGFGGAIAVASAAIAGTTVVSLHNDMELQFLAENNVAMTKMMAGMAIKPAGDADRDFVAMMVPHHQGAVDMAMAYLRFGHDEKLRRLAQEIIVTQQEEIAAMRLAVGEKPPPPAAAPTQIPPGDMKM